MTPEEMRAMIAALNANLQSPRMSGGMVDPYISMGGQANAQLQNLDPKNMPGMTQMPDTQIPSQMPPDTKGQRRQLESMQAYANQLRGTPMPGLKTVGPSNIAVANPWDSLEAGFNRAYGGHLQGKLNKQYEDYDKQDSDRAAALLGSKRAVEDDRIEEQRAFTTAQEEARRAHDLVMEERRQAAEDARYDRNEEKAAKRAQLGLLDEKGIEDRMESNRDYAETLQRESRNRIVKAQDKQREASGPTKKNSADKRVTYLAKTSRIALNNLKNIVYGNTAEYPTKDSKMKYNPGGTTAMWNTSMMNIGGPARWLASADGQIYAAATETIRDSLLRMATGAAAPTSEQISFFKALIPAYGDKDETVAMKMKKMDQFITLLEEAGGPDDGDRAGANVDMVIARMNAEDAGKRKGTASPPGGKRRETRNDLSNITEEDIDSMDIEELRASGLID